MLLPGQSLLFSVPRGPGEAALEIEIAWEDDLVSVREPAKLVAKVVN